MSLSANTQAILLLTAHLGNAGDEAARPLTTKEWGRFALWLREKALMPEDLLTGNLADKLQGWSDAKIPFARIEGLLNRGSALAICLEKWTRAGLWVMTRSDPDYPKRLKARLKNDSPAILFGCGNRALLNQGGLAVVGSRKAVAADLDYTTELGKLVSLQGNSIVSGGAKGVDETAMLAALDVEGTVIGVLVDSLLRATSSTRYRKHLMNNNLVLISPFNPEAGFNAGHAMQRNKYIYCLADVAVAVHSGKDGGTWEGAIENLKHEWVPLWVKSTDDPAAGNAGLVAKGASWLSADITQVDLDTLMQSRVQKVEEPDLFSSFDSVDAQVDSIEMPAAEPEVQPEPEPFVQTDEGEGNDKAIAELEPGSTQKTLIELTADDSEAKQQPVAETVVEVPIVEIQLSEEVDETVSEASLPVPPMTDISFYELFLAKLQPLLSGAPQSVDELVEALGINKAQLNTWLAQAVEDKKIKKNNKPVSYEWVKQTSLI